ncbi:hypothetical protein AVEN_217904-1 [Araneus ventricosus]|uniref:Uncharacterized protein n=1 Tax=Araneus ventricosus TaxID=182803 RepID=A0A4Y2EJH6_ARAVE|nr:hypothetical protein AVEN_217904-1 [Araneus ventricosus]
MPLKPSPLNIIQPSGPRYDEDLQKLLNEIGSDFSDENNRTEDFLMKVHIRLFLNYPNLKMQNVNQKLKLLQVNIIIIAEILLSGHSETKRTIRITAYNIMQLPELVYGYFL